jgi:hypothetical protein
MIGRHHSEGGRRTAQRSGRLPRSELGSELLHTVGCVAVGLDQRLPTQLRGCRGSVEREQRAQPADEQGCDEQDERHPARTHADGRRRSPRRDEPRSLRRARGRTRRTWRTRPARRRRRSGRPSAGRRAHRAAPPEPSSGAFPVEWRLATHHSTNNAPLVGNAEMIMPAPGSARRPAGGPTRLGHWPRLRRTSGPHPVSIAAAAVRTSRSAPGAPVASRRWPARRRPA